MLVNKIVRYFNGEIYFEASNGFGERLINLCAANNILMRDFKKTPEGFRASVSPRDYKTVKKLAKKANVETRMVTKQGFMFKANKYKSRWGLMVGILLFIGFICVMQCFVWEIEVVGNESVKTEVILSELKDLGVHRFSFIPKLDFRMQKQKALLRLPQLSWLTINRSGCKLSVNVSERKYAPPIKENTPCDIIAAKTGQIRYMEVYNGTKLIGEKYTVSKGDKIISGTFTNKAGEVTYVHSDAKIIAEVQFEKTLSIDIGQLSKEYTGKSKTRYFLDFNSVRLPLFLATKQEGNYDITEENHPLVLFGKKMPVGICSKRYDFYNKKPQKLSIKEAREVLDNCFLQYEASELGNSAILDRKVTQTLENNVLKVRIEYIVEEDIAQKQEIIFE